MSVDSFQYQKISTTLLYLFENEANSFSLEIGKDRSHFLFIYLFFALSSQRLIFLDFWNDFFLPISGVFQCLSVFLEVYQK